MYLIQTVQTSWRPQLPLPKEIRASDDNADINRKPPNNMERIHHSSTSNKKDNASLNGSQISNVSGSHGKKWSFGRLFRKKKDVESDSSSEEDRKAGFVPANKYPRGSNNNNNCKTKTKSTRNSKLIGAGFDHIVLNSSQQPSPTPAKRPPPPEHLDNQFFLPFEIVSAESYYQNQQPHATPLPKQYLNNFPQQQQTRSSNSLDRRGLVTHAPHNKSSSTQRIAPDAKGQGHPSSEEELISLNSSTFAKYRSDESIHSGGQAANGQSRRSRAARNERYYKRLSRDGEVSNGQGPVMYAPQPAQRWKTQPVPLSIYNGTPKAPVALNRVQIQHPSQSITSQRLRNTGSLQHVAPYVQWGQAQQQPKNLQNSMNDNKRSISYDSHIHLQNANGRLQTKPLPPPPPPRDPMRRLQVTGQINNNSSGDLRPVSYAFDANGLAVMPTPGLAGRCVSDDKIWSSQVPHYQSAQSLHMPSTNHQELPQNTQHRRFITRAERDALPCKKSLPSGIDMQYMTDAHPRSRKPIHMLEQQEMDIRPPTHSSGVLRTSRSGLPDNSAKTVATDFWKRLDEGSQKKRGCDAVVTKTQSPIKPRSISSSRVGELRTYPIPMYSEVCKPSRKSQIKNSTPDNGTDEVDNVVCGSLHIKPSPDNSNNFVEIRNKDNTKSNSMPNHYQRRSGEIPTTPNKYEEYVAGKKENHHNPFFDPPAPPQRKMSIPPNLPQSKASSQPADSIYFPHKKPANLEEAINELEAIYKSLRLGNDDPVCKERIPTPSEFEKFALARADSYEDEESPTEEPDPVRDDVAFRNMKLANLPHKNAEKQPPFGIPIGPIVPSPHNDYLHVTPDNDKKKTVVVVKNVPDIIKDDLAVRTLRKDAPGSKHQFAYPTGSLQKKNRATRTQSANIYSLIQRDAAKPSGGDLFSYMELTRNIDRSGSMSDIHKSEAPADIPGTLKLLQNLKEEDQKHNSLKKSQIPFRHPSQGGAICKLPEKLSSLRIDDSDGACKPVPLPRKSLTPEPKNSSHQMEDALNKIAKDAQESSAKLSKDLLELRKEALITSSRSKNTRHDDINIAKDLQEIEAVSEAAKRCGKMLLDTLPDSIEESNAMQSNINSRKLHKEGKLIQAIDEVSEAANAVCEKILKDMVTTDLAAIEQESVHSTQVESLVMPNLIKKLDPIKSEQIEAIAKRCMRQISQLAEIPDYVNIQPGLDENATCNDVLTQVDPVVKAHDTIISTVAEKKNQSNVDIEEIDKIMQECEAQVRSEGGTSTVTATVSQQQLNDDKKTAPSITTSCSSRNSGPSNATTASSFSSSSDCLAKSSSPSASRRQSSSITSFNPYSSSDYIKSPSSEFHAPSTDPIKTFSTTSYDVQSTSVTPNITTNSTFSYSPSPPLNLTPVEGHAASEDRGPIQARERSSSPSQYNSSEELAMIFGIEEKSKQRIKSQHHHHQQQQHLANTGNVGLYESMSSTSSNHASSVACTPEAHQLTNPNAACENVVDYLNVIVATNAIQPTNTNSPSSYKLDTIPEIVLENDCHDESESTLKLSPNFNHIYASKISIIVDEVTENTDQSGQSEESSLSPNNNSQFDSLGSLEETSSNPDSGNVSLADFPIFAGNTNACLQLQTACNSRFKIRNSFVSEICISSQSNTDEGNRDSENEFPRLPTDEELLDSLREEINSSSTNSDNELNETLTTLNEPKDYSELSELLDANRCNKIEPLEGDLNQSTLNGEFGITTLPIRRSSIVYETPKLNMNISEVRLNFESDDSAKENPSLEIDVNAVEKNCTEVSTNNNALSRTSASEDLTEELIEVPRRRPTTRRCMDDLSKLSWQPMPVSTRPNDGSNSDQKPTNSSQVVSMLGEANSLTMLEQVIMACTLGVVSSNDLFTLFLIIIGIVTIIAIVLF